MRPAATRAGNPDQGMTANTATARPAQSTSAAGLKTYCSGRRLPARVVVAMPATPAATKAATGWPVAAAAITATADSDTVVAPYRLCPRTSAAIASAANVSSADTGPAPEPDKTTAATTAAAAAAVAVTTAGTARSTTDLFSPALSRTR